MVMIIEIAMESTIKLFMNQIHFCMSIKRILLKSNLQITYKLFNWHGIEGKDWLNCLDQVGTCRHYGGKYDDLSATLSKLPFGIL